MMLAALLLAAAGPTAIDAERAFAADAQAIGQWSAFRKWSADDAVMFTPQPVNAHEFLKDRKGPARAIDWWPTASFVSCDGSFAINTGGWSRPDGSVGYFSTVWQRQSDGSWKWIVDGGDALTQSRERPADVTAVRADCGGKDGLAGSMTDDSEGARSSTDQTLTSRYVVGGDGSRRFTARLWDGGTFRTVIDDRIAAPK